MAGDVRVGGAYQPQEDYDCTSGTRRNLTLTSPTLSGTTTIGAGATLTSPTLTSPTITSPVVTSGTFATPDILFTAASVTATGTTGSNAAALSTVTPAFYATTGASGAGVALPTGPAGAVYTFRNNISGILNVYCVGGTLNGTTGTTAYAVSATGNLYAQAFCLTATGAWQIGGNT